MMYELKQRPNIARNLDVKGIDDDGEDGEEERLEIVDLSGMSFETVPNPPLNLACICKLDLSNNNLQIIPESLTARLLNMVVLDIHSNQLKSLPNSIGCLSKLKVLNVASNLLLSLPKAIKNCRCLEELNVNFNKLSRLPDKIGFELGNLERLFVNSNLLASLPSSLTNLTSLKLLDARLNKLRSLPEDLENLIHLEVLNVSQNFQCLEALPYSIGMLISLVELDVSYNKIKTLPASICCLRRLKRLSVDGNPLVSPPTHVVEQGVHAVKDYLSRHQYHHTAANTNTMHHQALVVDSCPPKKKYSSWICKLVKYKTLHAERSSEGSRMPLDALLTSPPPPHAYKLKRILLSPRRLFSPKKYFHQISY